MSWRQAIVIAFILGALAGMSAYMFLNQIGNQLMQEQNITR